MDKLKESIMSPDPLDEEENREQNIRPVLLDQFQGQNEIKENLSIFINAARERKEALDHLFISGPPGLGKTTLAGIMANELKADFKVTSAPALDKPKDLAGLLTTISERTVFFIDEIHRLKPAIEEMLYIAMEDYELDWVIGQGPAARSVRIPVPPFTLVGATTRPGKVTGPLHTRFGITVRISFYNDEELCQIIQRSAEILHISIDKKAAMKLAASSRGTPRIANRLLRRMRDFAQHQGLKTINSKIVEEGLKRLKIDNIGLEPIDRQILTSIIKNYNGGPVGAENLAISIGESIDTLEEFYEPYLIQKGLLQRTPRGRTVTSGAYEHLGLEITHNNENQELLF